MVKKEKDGIPGRYVDIDVQKTSVFNQWFVFLWILALVVQEFMNTTKTQLTHYGLHVLQESLPEGHLCAFFRNNHVS